MDQPDRSSTSPQSPPIEITCSRYFLQWLHEQQISIAFTTYQTNRLFLIGLKPDDGQLSAFERLFDRPMGLCATPDRLYMSARYQLWQFDNALAPGESYNGYDKLYVPRVGHTTGDLDVHDVTVAKAGRVIFVNTLYSCLATLSERYSFVPLWQPPFISKLAPEDRCHLNGLALVEGTPHYVTAVSRSDVAAGWRERRQDGGCVVDVRSNQVILTGLSMPHSPRFYRGRLWLLNSGAGEFGYVDTERGTFEPVAFCPGYLRGLAFHGHCAVMGLSKPRERTFSGLALDERLAAKDAQPRCGLMVIDLDTGNVLHWLALEGLVTELYDVQVLPGVRCPMSLGFKSDEISRIIAIDHPPSVTLHTLSAVGEPVLRPAPVQKEAQKESTPGEAYKFHLSLDMTVAAAIKDYEALTFPSLRKQAQVRAISEPLVTVAVSYQGQFIGLALAEVHPDGELAQVLSLFVIPEHRGHRVGTALLAHLEQALAREGCPYADLAYQSDWPGAAAMERLLRSHDWAPPQVRVLFCKTTTERIAAAPWLHQASPSEGFTIFPWSELTPQERQAVEGWQATALPYPPAWAPFQGEEQVEPLNSLGVRHRARW